LSKIETEINPKSLKGRISFSDNEDKKGIWIQQKGKQIILSWINFNLIREAHKNRLARINQASRAEHHRAYSRCVLQTIQAKPSSIRTPPNTPINPT
jgi:hypothetical protein